MFHGIAKFSASRFGIVFCGHLLKHSFLAKEVNESPFFKAEMTTNCREIFPHRSVSDKSVAQVLLDLARFFAKSKTPDVKRSMRCTTNARCLF